MTILEVGSSGGLQSRWDWDSKQYPLLSTPVPDRGVVKISESFGKTPASAVGGSDEAKHMEKEPVKDCAPKRFSLSETSFYILLALQEERYGYEIRQWVRRITDGEFELQAGTLYNSLARLERDGLIRLTREDDGRKYYSLTDLGRSLLHSECQRLHRAYQNSCNQVWKKRRRIQPT